MPERFPGTQQSVVMTAHQLLRHGVRSSFAEHRSGQKMAACHQDHLIIHAALKNRRTQITA